MTATMSPLPERSTTFRVQSDYPVLSPSYCAKRNRLLSQIRRDSVCEDYVMPFLEIEITGLELLRLNSEEEQSDFSYDSYCADSFEVIGPIRSDAPRAVSAEQLNRVVPNSIRRQWTPRRFSCTSIEENPTKTTAETPFNGEESSTQDIDYGYGRIARRASVGSNENSSADYSNAGRHSSRFVRQASRRSSFGSYANDSVDYGRQNRMIRQLSRRSSLGSYANDSVDYGRQSRMSRQLSRRSSIGSYANDSIEYSRRVPRQVCRRSSVGSKSSIGSNTNDSTIDYGYENESQELHNYGRNMGARRSSLDSYDSFTGKQIASRRCSNSRLHRQPHQQRRFSNYSDFANDSVEVARQNKTKKGLTLTGCSHFELKQRQSEVSADGSGFAPEVFSTQSINTGGTNRAA